MLKQIIFKRTLQAYNQLEKYGETTYTEVAQQNFKLLESILEEANLIEEYQEWAKQQ